MYILPTSEESRKIDQISQTLYGISGEVLMESAGALSAHRIRSLYPKSLTKGGIFVFCGHGNNGGDGLVLARHLHSSGYQNLKVFVLSWKGSFLFEKQLCRVKNQNIPIILLSKDTFHCQQNSKSLPKDLKTASLIVDALFGKGLSKDITDTVLVTLIDHINRSSVPLMSLDVPSGLDPNRGVVRGKAIKAHRTLSLGLASPGFFMGKGPSYVGKLEVLPLGFPQKAVQEVAKTYFLISKKWVRNLLPLRTNQGHKAHYGALLLIAGRPGLWGSGVLASTAAYRMGAGYVIWGSHEEPLKGLKQIPEVLTQKTSTIIKELKQKKSLSLNLSQSIKAVAIGPGLGVEEKTASLIRALKIKMQRPEQGAVILDADAITSCVTFKLFPLPSHWVLTPHRGELLRVLQNKEEEKEVIPTNQAQQRKEKQRLKAYIETHPFDMAFEASKKAGCHILLKGYHSLLIRKKQCFIIPSGNTALSKAGSGDVLTGMIGGLLAQGLNSFQATALGAYLHGKIADEWKKRTHETFSLNPSDLKDSFSSVIGNLLQKP